jgi:hypothetical protein
MGESPDGTRSAAPEGAARSVPRGRRRAERARADAPAAQPARASLRRRVGVALVALLATLLCAEIALRAYAAATRRVRGVTTDALLGWRMLPGIEKTGNGWCARVPARTNAHGWRDAEHDYVRVPGRARILALGDSFTFGWNVDFGARFTERLAELLGAEVINMGASAYGPDQELLGYEREGRLYEPDVVVWQLFAGNDLEDLRSARKSGWPKPYFRRRGEELELVPPRHTWLERMRVHSYLLEVVLEAVRHGGAQARAPEWQNGSTLPLLGLLARRLSASVEQSGGRLLAVIAHATGAPPDDGEAMRRELAAQGIAVLDLRDVLSGADGAALFLPCGHWTDEAHRRVARAIADELQRRHWM